MSRFQTATESAGRITSRPQDELAAEGDLDGNLAQVAKKHELDPGLLARLIELERSPFHKGPGGINIRFSREIERCANGSVSDAPAAAPGNDRVRLVALHLRNFGPFREATLHLKRDSERPVCLIEANNGRGKSTLVRALLFALHADHPETHGYPERLLHRGLSTPKAELKVELTLESEREGRIDVRRTVHFQAVGDEFHKHGNENLDVLVGGQDLHSKDAVEWLATHFPPQVLGYFVFDAEHSPISNLSGQLGEQLPQVRQQVEAILGVGPLKSAAKRCDTLSLKWEREIKDDDAHATLERLHRDLQTEKRDAKHAESQRIELEDEVRTARRDEEDRLKEWQRLKQGIIPNVNRTRQALAEKLGQLKEQVHKLDSSLSDAVALDLPLLLVEPLLRKAADRTLPKDAPREFLKGARFALRGVAELLTDGKLRWTEPKTEPKVEDDFDHLCGIWGIPRTDKLAHPKHAGLRDTAKRAACATSPASLAAELEKLQVARDQIQHQLRELGPALDASLHDAINRAHQAHEDAKKRTFDAEDALDRVGREVDVHKARANDIERDLPKAEAKAQKAKKCKAEIKVAKAAKRALLDLANREVGARLDRVEQLTSALLRQITNKPDLFHRIRFDRNTLRFELLDPEGRRVPPDPSTGERTVLALAIVHGLQAGAGTWLPMVVEAPLRPLDPGHVDNVVKHYLATREGQTVLLEVPGKIAGAHRRALALRTGQFFVIERHGSESLLEARTGGEDA